MNAAITLQHWAGRSENFLEYAIKQACYIYNKIPHSENKNLIPHEMFKDNKVSIKPLGTFGCICYYKDFTQHKPKFAPNAKKRIFLGFDNQTYLYIVIDEEDLNIHHVREVECLEKEPLKFKNKNTSKKDLYFTFENINRNDMV